MTAIHECAVVYGSYSGTVKVRCDVGDDMETIRAKVRRQESLNFLSMATFSVKILNTQYLPEYE